MSYNWKNVLLSPDKTIKDALYVINQEALRIAIIADDERRLLGVVTDGDIRRGLLSNLSLEAPVVEVMNKCPVTTVVENSRAKNIELMKEKGLLSLPVVEDGIVQGLETLQQQLVQEKHGNPVFIMAGGFGTRLRPLTDNCPKPMLKIGRLPILEILIRQFRDAGFYNFFISTHYMPEVIHEHFGNGENLDINITYVHEDAPLGTGGALGLLPSQENNLPIIMMNGDVLTKVDFERLLKFHNENDAKATMCVREYEYQIPYGVVNGEGIKIKSMVEKPIERFFINAGIYVVNATMARNVPQNLRIDMPTLLEQEIDKMNDVLMFPVHEYWLDIGRMDDFQRAQQDINTLGLLSD